MKRIGILSAMLCLCLPVLAAGLSASASAQMMVLPGKFDVTPEGVATFSVPVSVPPGTGGMVPSLSVDYTSGGSNGLLGVGWGVDGLLVISRCPQTMAQDGDHDRITYDVGITAGQTDNDRFCLNGQRLLAIAGSGNYGADGTEYRTEIESYSRIVSHGYVGSSPAYFDVYTKSGQIMEFGNTADSRAMFANTSAVPSARSWLVDKISDTVGNYMTVKYTVNPDAGVSGYSEVVPKEIDYTGNSATGLLPYNKVTFVYANGTRPDINPLYEDGNLVETTQLLTNLKTWSGTQASPGSTEVNDYQLAYTTSPSTGRELLSSVKICDGADSNCLPARTFTYQGGSPATFSGHQVTSGLGTYPVPPSSTWSQIEGDFNGDGKVDFGFIQNTTLNVYLSNGDGTVSGHQQALSVSFGSPPESSNPFANGVSSPPTSPYFIVQGDFNGDGKGDFALVLPGSVTFVKPKAGNAPPTTQYNNGAIYVFLSNGNGTFTLGGQTIPYVASSTEGLVVVPGDFRGNGETDFAMVTGSTIYTYLSNGNGSFTASTQAIGQSYGSSPTTSWTSVAGDFNGDGETDFALISGSGSGDQIYAYLSNGNGTFYTVSQLVPGDVGSPPTAGWIPVTGDFSGDGLTDIAFVGSNSIYTLMSLGNGTFANLTQSLGGLNYGSPPQGNWTPIEGDFTGAGLTDFALLSGTTMWAFISNGNGTFTPENRTEGGNYGAPPAAQWTPIAGDFNGDGLSDFAFLSGSTLNTYLNNGPYPDLLTSISNGVGANTTVSYSTPASLWGFLYSGWNTSICNTYAPPYPIIDVTPSEPVVYSTSSTTGIGATGSAASYITNFSYACAREDLSGRGSLGFVQQVAFDPQTGIDQTTDFMQGYPYTGLISVQSKTLGSVTLNETINYYSALTPSSTPALPWWTPGLVEVAPQFPYVATSVTTNNDLNGAALPTVTTTNTYDAYGDPVTIAISKALGSTQGPTQTTTNTYQAPNTTAPYWILGRLTQSQVVSTTP